MLKDSTKQLLGSKLPKHLCTAASSEANPVLVVECRQSLMMFRQRSIVENTHHARTETSHTKHACGLTPHTSTSPFLSYTRAQSCTKENEKEKGTYWQRWDHVKVWPRTLQLAGPAYCTLGNTSRAPHPRYLYQPSLSRREGEQLGDKWVCILLANTARL